MSSPFSHLVANANNPNGIRETSQNPNDMIRAALDGRADLGETIRRIMSSGVGVQAISNIFTDIGMQKSTVASSFVKGVGILGAGQVIKDYAKTLDRRESKDFLDHSGYGKSGGKGEYAALIAARREAAEKAMKEADHMWASSFGSLSHGQQGEVLSHMLFSPGHDAFWDQMAASGQIHQATADTGKRLAAEFPAEAQKKSHAIDAALDGANLSPEDRAKAEDFKKSKEGKELAERLGKIEQLKKLEEEAKKNGDIEMAKRAEEQRLREQQAVQAQMAQIAQTSPPMAAALGPVVGPVIGATSKQNAEAAARESSEIQRRSAEAGTSSAAALASMTAQVAAEGSTKGVDQRIREDKAAQEVAARAVVDGSLESKFHTGKVVAARALALGVLGEKEIDKANKDIATVETKKDATVAAKVSGGLKAADSDDMFDAAPPINVAALDKMRTQKTEAAPASAKTASMSA